MLIRRLSGLVLISALTLAGCNTNTKSDAEKAAILLNSLELGDPIPDTGVREESVKVGVQGSGNAGDVRNDAGNTEVVDSGSAEAGQAVADSGSAEAGQAVADSGAAEEPVGVPEAAAGEEAAAVPAQEMAVAGNSIDSLNALTADQMKKLDEIVWDLEPEKLNAVLAENEGGHFPFSDEKHLDLFRESIENLGGTYMGVGTDQGYLFTGWQRPTLAFMIDYDPWVVAIHQLYIAFWRECEDSACLHHLFDDRDAGMEFITGEKGTAAGLNNKNSIKIYKSTQRSIGRQLKRVEKMSVKTFMNDAESFSYIKKLIEQGRLRTFQANLLGDRAFASVSATLNELGAKVTTLYLSNAEQYWGYSAQFKKNITELPSSENGLILRTSATYPVNNDYRYSIQPISVFKAWLNHPEGKSVRQVTKRVRGKGPEDFPFVVDDFMPPAEDVKVEGK